MSERWITFLAFFYLVGNFLKDFVSVLLTIMFLPVVLMWIAVTQKEGEM